MNKDWILLIACLVAAGVAMLTWGEDSGDGFRAVATAYEEHDLNGLRYENDQVIIDTPEQIYALEDLSVSFYTTTDDSMKVHMYRYTERGADQADVILPINKLNTVSEEYSKVFKKTIEFSPIEERAVKFDPEKGQFIKQMKLNSGLLAAEGKPYTDITFEDRLAYIKLEDHTVVYSINNVTFVQGDKPSIRMNKKSAIITVTKENLYEISDRHVKDRQRSLNLVEAK